MNDNNQKKSTKKGGFVAGVVVCLVLVAALIAIGNIKLPTPAPAPVPTEEGTVATTEAPKELTVSDLMREVTTLKKALEDAAEDLAEGNLELASLKFDNADTKAVTIRDSMAASLEAMGDSMPSLTAQMMNIQELTELVQLANRNLLQPLIVQLGDRTISGILCEDGINVSIAWDYLDFLESRMPELTELVTRANSADLSIVDSDGDMTEYLDKLSQVLEIYQADPSVLAKMKTVLGADGDRLYVVAAQNSAEVRASGGFPGAVGSIQIRDGILVVNDFTKVYSVFATNTPPSANITQTEARLGEDAADAEAQLEAVTAQLRELEARAEEAEGNLARKEAAEKALPGQEQQVEALTRQLGELEKKLSSLGALLTSKQEQIASLASQLHHPSRQEAGRALAAQREQLGNLKAALENAEKEHADRKEAVIRLHSAVEQLKRQLEAAPQIDGEAEQRRQTEIQTLRQQHMAKKQAADARIAANAPALASIRKRQQELDGLEARYAWVRSLSNTANGNISGKEKVMLETYVQMTCFDRIIARANLRLTAMTGGQYQLRRRTEAGNNKSQSGLELDVIDHYNGTERSVNTLSGGESFKASLALALGLSDVIQSSSGGVKLDTMFVDEGFGSLDEESLNQAVKALVSLTEGNRLVGIISHVSDLKERIDRQIVVTKDKLSGSHAEIIV